MIVTKDYERLYLSSWQYNASLILSELAKIVENHGGRVKPMKHAIISNRNIDENIRELEEHINKYQRLIKFFPEYTTKFKTAINKVQAEITELSKIDNSPVTVTHTSYIIFILDDTYYSYSVNDNPFFEFYYAKTPVQNNRYSKDTYLAEDKKEWLYDCFFDYNCAKADIKEGANLIFNMLMNAPYSDIYREYTHQRIANIYDDGYHYEKIMTPERFGKIEF